jgi:uncharacterized protein YPO0396
VSAQPGSQSGIQTRLYADSYLLSRLDLYNWGPFARRHQVEIDAQGSAIIGATGSGKTTLVDALMTLICERPKYNLASTGGHESDRDLVSYIRGKTGEGNNADDSHIARSGKTVSAIAASFGNGHKTLQIAALLWLDSSSSALSDLKRLWVFNHSEDQDLNNLLELHHQGGAKAVKRQAKFTPNLNAYDSKKAYLAQLRRFFEVGENAFTLLNRAAGLKQLNSIDEIFRELVLDDNAAFERAAEVVKGFDTLTTIHEELVVARNQHSALLPIQREAKKHARLCEQRDDLKQLLALTPVYYAEQRLALLQSEAEFLQQKVAGMQLEDEQLQNRIELIQHEIERLQSAYMAAGGGDVEELQRSLQRWQDDLKKVSEAAEQYQRLVRRFELNDQLDQHSFTNNRSLIGQKRQDCELRLFEHRIPLRAAISAVEDLRRKLAANEAERQQVAQRPSSNIPPAYDAFRSELARQLDMDDKQLPYLAELAEVKPEQADWRGAVERAIGSHRLRIVVPEPHMDAALRWINNRDNRLHVRLFEMPQTLDQVQFFEDGFCRKLNYKKHPYRQAARQLLAGLDRHCVDSPEALRATPHGMTREGLMSGRKGLFEKQDQKRLDRDWMTGFDNRDRLALLAGEQELLQQQLQAARDQEKEAEQAVQSIEAELQQLQALLQLSFADIDTTRIKAEIKQYQQRLDSLLNPDSDTAKAREQWRQVTVRQQVLNDQATDIKVALRTSEHELHQVNNKIVKTTRLVGQGLKEEQSIWMQSRVDLPDREDDDALVDHEKLTTRQTNEALSRIGERITDRVNSLIRHMGNARRVDTGALAETGSELRDIPDYLKRLDVLTKEALPEKEKRFLEYLRNSSDQSVTQLLSGVENEVTIIEERINDLNDTMLQVDFQPGRFLQLNPQRVVHESIRTLTKAQRYLNSARLKDDKGESHYKALQQVVALVRDAAENRKKVGSRALLDPRYRLQFSVSVIDRQEQKIIETRSGSQGGSGGEKEIIASYILTASLSYALCPPGASRPLFGTIVLDEAFSKSSQAVAGRIVSALRQFGLHPLFVTPNKEMQLLRTHTRSAVLIHRKGMNATTTSMSWQELRDCAQQVKSSTKKAQS